MRSARYTVAALLLLTGLSVAGADPISPTAPLGSATSGQEWFIQVWFDVGLPVSVEDGDDPGRVEVSISGRFVACQTASFYKDKWDRVVLVPTALGATARGLRDDIKVQAYGELGRLVTPRVKITAVDPAAVQNP